MKEFVHRAYQPGETVAAIATPPGEGGIAVVRISGHDALAVAERVFSGPVRSYKSHTAHLGKVLDTSRRVVDEALLLVMLAPRTYTGEDTVEIQCHGGSLITRKVLDTVLQAGARAAEPGEFTFKAFMNGKLDLAQAEAVQALIGAKNELALQVAEQQLQGRLSATVSHFQQDLVDIAAILEAWVDFPEEDLAFAPMEEVIDQLKVILKKIEKLSSTFHEGKVISTGISLCLAGPPNVGKSSLMNALLGKERAIVTPIPGTTRDLLEEELRLGQLHVRLMDTAGIRETDEIVEKEGVRRSQAALKDADLVLFVLDASQRLCPSAEQLLQLAPREKTLLIWNKSDLCTHEITSLEFTEEVVVSAKTGEGLEQLKQAIDRFIWKKGPPSKEEITLTNVRHQRALETASLHLSDVIEGLKTGISPEFVASDMQATLKELGMIIGMNIQEDILTAIFSKFCIGK